MIKTGSVKRIFASLAAAALFCGGCGGTQVTETQPPGTDAVRTTTGIRPPSTAAAIADEDELIRPEEKQPLRIAVENLGGTYSPFFPAGDFAKTVDRLIGVKLLSRDRNGEAVTKGIAGETRGYNGKKYTYTGISDVSQYYNEEEDETVYSFRLRDDVRFSDGEALDADDVIFTLYMLLDPSVSSSPLRLAGIKGEKGYRLNYAIADTLTDEDLDELLDEDEVKQRIRDMIVEPALTERIEWVDSLYGDNSYSVYTETYPEPKDLLAFFYSIDSGYDSSEAQDIGQVVSDLADMYGGNFELLGSMDAGDPDEFRAEAQAIAIAYYAEQNGSSETVSRISGIKKTGDLSLEITAKGNSPLLLRLLTEVTVAPMHYYGDSGRYNYERDRFGLVKKDAARMMQEKNGVPLGAGAYRFEKSENGTVVLSANEYYYKGAPQIERLEFSRGDVNGMVGLVADGGADISFPDACALTSEEVESANSALEKLAAFAVMQDGYGFIGINAKTVNIGGEPLSGESCALRAALTIPIYAYRESSVNEYYGRLGFVVNYPSSVPSIIKSSAPELAGYADAVFCRDPGGDPFLTVEYADETSRRKAIKRACLEYLKLAGYTVENDRVTDPPEGGAAEFHAVIAAGGRGDHPSYGALREAKSLLGEIGIRLEINDTADASHLWSEISGGTQEIWAYVWETGVGADLGEMYSEDNLFGVDSDELSDQVEVTGSSSDKLELAGAYVESYKLVYGSYAVEVPMYQRSGCVLVSALRVDAKTLPEDMTCYYGWTEEAEKITQKG